MDNNTGVIMKKMLFIMAFMAALAAQAANNTQKMPPTASVCIACHGVDGNSHNPLWPNLAGQHARYTLKQLHNFKKGKSRNNPVMQAMVSTLTNAEMQELAAFYENQPVAIAYTPKKYLRRGEQLYRGGDLNKHISACMACHGPRGEGYATAGFPRLAGQHAKYTIAQLRAFKHKTRHNDLNGIMRSISKRMNNDDIKAIAWYIQGLH